MASNKDILEAQRYNRRRLVTAFSSGTPGGREIETPNNLRPLLIGGVIAAVILIVAAVMGRFSPTLPKDWQNSTMVVVKSTGARYYSIDATLRPVTNITSAKLLSEPGSYKTSSVAVSTIEGIPRGSQVGITGIPDDVPAAADLASEKWLSCALPTGVHTWVAGIPEGASPAQVALVTNNERQYLVTGGTRYLLDTTGTLGPARALGLDQVAPINVDAAWLDLFSKGSDLAALSIDDAGIPVKNMPDALASSRIGTIIEVRDESDAQAPTRAYIVTGNGRIASLSSVARQMYELSVAYRKAGNPLTASIADIQNLDDDGSFGPADWPALVDVEKVVDTESAPCASLAFSDSGAGTDLMSMSVAAATKNIHAHSQESTSPTPPAQSSAQVTVRGGSGALVRASSGGSFGATMFISDIGRAHSLGDNPSDAIARLSWTSDDVVLIPSAWTKLVEPGEDMTADSVWKTVGAQ
ncbi:type VII secretion protein EccB [Schaalia vaccimaxillae]|uniref:type VII secretion protein EccB n=1 Tax=Schaalia vaccimaxillae TaxID=183916 RepID=UPI0004095CD0|nr:type VII secretion protein EccB [Schaalia vaccimaxillae]